jgi:hypothetical protein
VRYAAKEGAKNRFRPDNGMRGKGGHTFYDGLVFTAPRNALTVPIWVTARVPADAVPGDYEGKLRVTRGTDAPVTVPVTLAVCAWKSPDPKDFVSHAGLIESPESVALKYKVPLWAEKHLALIGPVIRAPGADRQQGAYGIRDREHPTGQLPVDDPLCTGRRATDGGFQCFK